MVFNSFSFIFLFLPITVSGFFLVGQRHGQRGAVFLTLASLCFYSCWNVHGLAILLSAILLNFWAGQRLAQAGHGHGKPWLSLAVAGNVLLLGYFKYVDFFIATLNAVLGLDVALLRVALPVGISFFTFTQIAFLVDAYHGKIQDFNFIHYFLFVAYFPYIVAGPVLQPREMLPQFAAAQTYRPKAENVALGIALFVFGLAKKLLIADNLPPLVDPVFATPHPPMLQAWAGLLAYSFQLYFDFSGYSDMAIGVSRLLGIQLPLNFNSPYKAVSISDFWQRWHMSLSRFLRDYLYIPLGGNRCGQFNRYRNLMLTMLLGGLWHGANWTFVIWGGLHGLYLCVQHGWQAMQARQKAPRAAPAWANRALTFGAVAVAWCFFRAPNVSTALDVLAGVAGRHGVSGTIAIDPLAHATLAASALIAFFLPNTQEIFQGIDTRPATGGPGLRWSPDLHWGVLTGLVFAVCLLCLERVVEFIYVQF